jgi:hypothetical protein
MDLQLTEDAPIYTSAMNAKQGFREFHAARRTIRGYEAMNMILKRQLRRVKGEDVQCQNRFIESSLSLPPKNRLWGRSEPISADHESCNTTFPRVLCAQLCFYSV